MPMEKKESRLFNCTRCNITVMICSNCDRGNMYCGQQCSLLARKQSMLIAGKQYQNSYKGRVAHALRQKRYRDWLKQKVTHHGSQEQHLNVLLSSNDIKDKLQQKCNKNDLNAGGQCHFCGEICYNLSRRAFLTMTSNAKTANSTSWPLGP